MVTLAALAAAAYLLGSVPFGVVFASLAGKKNLREEGSGNIGATNVARVAGWAPGLATLAADAGKAAVPAALAAALSPAGSPWPALTAAAALVGHMFPIWTRFRGGGKGVATAAGGLAVLSPPALGGCLAGFAAMVAVTKRVSPGSLAAAVLMPPFLAVSGAPWHHVASGAAMSALVWFGHRKNIRRLLRGTEPRFFGGEKPPPGEE
ncbi:MAG: glycerol-3-phosphate acyltransferase [Deltaproteobacteria bacterium]|nr:glycerol-3-phosphate acyltransferase [Deltaproteobacteria bacterium]